MRNKLKDRTIFNQEIRKSFFSANSTSARIFLEAYDSILDPNPYDDGESHELVESVSQHLQELRTLLLSPTRATIKDIDWSLEPSEFSSQFEELSRTEAKRLEYAYDRIIPAISAHSYYLRGKDEVDSIGLQIPDLKTLEALVNRYLFKASWRSKHFERVLINALVLCETEAFLRERYGRRVLGVPMSDSPFVGRLNGSFLKNHPVIYALLDLTKEKLCTFLKCITLLIIGCAVGYSLGQELPVIIGTISCATLILHNAIIGARTRTFGQPHQVLLLLLAESGVEEIDTECFKYSLRNAWTSGIRLSSYLTQLLSMRLDLDRQRYRIHP